MTKPAKGAKSIKIFINLLKLLQKSSFNLFIVAVKYIPTTKKKYKQKSKSHYNHDDINIKRVIKYPSFIYNTRGGL